MNFHAEELRLLAETGFVSEAVRRTLRQAALYIDNADTLVNHCRESMQRQIDLRVAAEQRASRYAKDARR